MSIATVLPFVMGVDSKTFTTMRKLLSEGNLEMMAQVVSVTAMMESVTEDAVREAFAAASKIAEVQDALDSFGKEQIDGYTLPDSLLNLVGNGRELAERFGGTVQFYLDSDDDGNVAIVPRFRGIEGVTSGSTGTTGVRYDYFFDGKKIQGSLETFVLETFPASKTAAIFKRYADARAEGKKSRIGTITALNRGESEGDALGITWTIRETPGE